MRTLRNLSLPALLVAALLLAACTVTTTAGRPAPAHTPSGQGSPRPGSSPSALPTPDTRPVPPSTAFEPAQVAAILGPAVGLVLVTTARGGATGSGFVIAHDGGQSYMATNNHVVEGASKVQVLMPDGRHFIASVQGTDPVRDVAVIRIPDGSLPLATFADSSTLRAGQHVVAIGAPLGNQGSVTSGIISALHRSISAGGGGTTPENLPDVLQTDAAINPGNSGGPLADASGRVVGINTAASQGANNIGFAIPSNLARRIIEALIAGRKPGNPYLGVSYDSEDDALRKGEPFAGFGVVVTTVITGCPAERAGVRTGDTIQRVDGADLNNGQTLGGLIQVHNPGETVTLTIARPAGTIDVKATLIDRPANPDRC